jgi:hypothetical protein
MIDRVGPGGTSAGGNVRIVDSKTRAGSAMSHTPYAEIQINTYTTGNQVGAQISATPNGGWVVVWDSVGQDGDQDGVYQQRYDADGTTLGGEVLVNTTTTGGQYNATVTMLAAGGWVTTWVSDDQDGDSAGVYQQRYSADGAAIDGEVRVNTYTTGSQDIADVAPLKGGGWVVTWDSKNQDGDQDGVFQQAYNADGTTMGGETQVNTYTTGFQVHPYFAALSHGGWVVTWISSGADGDGLGIYQQRYRADGTATGGEVRVNTTTSGDENDSRVLALDDGGWVVAWDLDDSDGNGDSIYQQRYGSNGKAVGGEVKINADTTGEQATGLVSALKGGGWLVTWASWTGLDYSIEQRAYNADGTALGGAAQVNTKTAGSRYLDSVVALADGGWVDVWEANGKNGLNDVYQRVYNADGTARGGEILVNTTTTGNQRDASTTALADGGWMVTWYSDSGQDGDGQGVYQQRYDAYGQVYGSNHAPTAVDKTIGRLTNGGYALSKNSFSFSDGTDGDHFASVTITRLPSAGKLLLDGKAVSKGENIAAADLGDLVWQAGKHALSASIGFKVVDNGGTEAGGKDTSVVHTLTFAVKSDTFTGTKAADTLTGTDGHDILNGLRGNDRLTGGKGNDLFVFKTGDGRDTITDFHHSQHDRIDLSGVDGIASYRDLVKNHMTEGQGTIIISDGDGDTITLLHTSLGDLHKGDFVF